MRRPIFACLAVYLPLMAGCGGGVDERNFSRVKIGMTPQEVDAILGKGGKEISGNEVAALMREALTPQPAAGKAGTTPMVEPPDLSATRGVRWGDESKSVTVIYMNGRVSRLFKKGL